MSNKPSLQDQIKKRKQEEVKRTLQAQQIEKTKGPADAAPKRTAQVTPPVVRQTSIARQVRESSANRASQVAPSIASAARAPFQSLSSRQKTTLIAAGAAIMLLVVCVGTALIASGAAASANAVGSTPTLQPLALSSADALLQHFTELGIVVGDKKPYDLVGSKVWTAKQAYTFNIQRGDVQASFLVLSYDTAGHASDDMFKIMLSDKYKTWKSNIVANVVLLAAPGSKSEIVSDMFSHMLTFLYAPYHPWPTATLPPTATSAATTAATASK